MLQLQIIVTNVCKKVLLYKQTIITLILLFDKLKKLTIEQPKVTITGNGIKGTPVLVNHIENMNEGRINKIADIKRMQQDSNPSTTQFVNEQSTIQYSWSND